MKRRTHGFRPEATPLEAKRLLSLGAPAVADGQMAILDVRSGTTPAVAVASTVRGRYFASPDNRIADAPLHVRLAGAGSVDGIGRSALVGTLDLGGFRVAGSPDVTGTLTLANARGTVRLQLSGTGGAQDLPGGHLTTTVTVLRGTGVYRGFQRTGTATLDFGPNQVHPLRAPGPQLGTVGVTLNLKPLVK